MSTIENLNHPGDREHTWTFLTNHAHVLVCLARDPDMRLRDVAQVVGITERGVQRIVADLEQARVLTKQRDGRRNHYTIDPKIHLRHPIESHRTVGELLDLVQVATETPFPRSQAAG